MKITIKEFAEQAMKLTPGASIRFSVTDEDWKTLEYIISLVRVADYCCLLANRSGGGRPLAIDVTIYDEELLNICDALDKYINGSSGNYGYVDVIGNDYDGQVAVDAPGNVDLMSARLSVHLEWNRLSEIACNKLSELFGREINVESDRDDLYHWGFNIAGTPLSKEDIERLFLTVGANDFDRDSNDFGEYPIMEINQGLAEKMLEAELPFIMDSSHADSEGVWFFGPKEDEQVNIIISYPETDVESDVFRAILNPGTSKAALHSCFDEATKELADDDTDRLSRLDAVLDRVIEKAGCKKIGLLPIAFEVEIN